MKKLEFIISYDIRDSKRLLKVSKFMQKNTLRMQYSMYFIHCERKRLIEIVKELKCLINEDEDDIRIYKVNMKKSLFFQSARDVKDLII